MRDDPFGAVMRLLRMPHELMRFVSMLDNDTAHAMFTQLQERIDVGRQVHNHPPRPVCWACGYGGGTVMHEPTCHALVATALHFVNVEDDEWTARREGRPTNRQRFGAVLEEARRAGVDLGKIRANAHALQEWTRRDPPGDERPAPVPRPQRYAPR